MKKSPKTFWFLLILSGLVATVLIELAEMIFGIAAVFFTATIIVLIAGLVVLFLQAIQPHRK